MEILISWPDFKSFVAGQTELLSVLYYQNLSFDIVGFTKNNFSLYVYLFT